mmetsp:Transcript_24746/g.50218  ORF Transcript_24746/g.50218 Transcript_24746/m.50218 type:complete len:280 (+) Transcript_24746:164-1003(+)
MESPCSAVPSAWTSPNGVAQSAIGGSSQRVSTPATVPAGYASGLSDTAAALPSVIRVLHNLQGGLERLKAERVDQPRSFLHTWDLVSPRGGDVGRGRGVWLQENRGRATWHPKFEPAVGRFASLCGLRTGSDIVKSIGDGTFADKVGLVREHRAAEDAAAMRAMVVRDLTEAVGMLLPYQALFGQHQPFVNKQADVASHRSIAVCPRNVLWYQRQLCDPFRTLEGLRKLAPRGFFACRRIISERRQTMMQQAREAMPVISTRASSSSSLPPHVPALSRL